MGLDEVMVTFDPTYDENPTTLICEGTAVTHPDFGFSGLGGKSDPHDIAVILLDESVVGITPRNCPRQGCSTSCRPSTSWTTRRSPPWVTG